MMENMGVAPMPRPMRSTISYFLQSCTAEPYGPSISTLGKLQLFSTQKQAVIFLLLASAIMLTELLNHSFG